MDSDRWVKHLQRGSSRRNPKLATSVKEFRKQSELLRPASIHQTNSASRDEHESELYEIYNCQGSGGEGLHGCKALQNSQRFAICFGANGYLSGVLCRATRQIETN